MDIYMKLRGQLLYDPLLGMLRGRRPSRQYVGFITDNKQAKTWLIPSNEIEQYCQASCAARAEPLRTSPEHKD
jgi:hypothetical protein